MSVFTCADCGKEFTLRRETLDKYPGWVPKQCMACKSGRGAAARPGATSRAASGPVEENLTLDAVLAKYTKGPRDGVFTDGSATPNPGPGGWGAVYVVDNEVVDQAHGAEPHTTNNRMELTALIAGFGLVPEGVATTIYTDSRLVVDTITKWARGWEQRGWRRKTGEIANLDLVKQVYARAQSRPDITIEWIKAHDGSRWNEYADSLSTAYLREHL